MTLAPIVREWQIAPKHFHLYWTHDISATIMRLSTLDSPRLHRSTNLAIVTLLPDPNCPTMHLYHIEIRDRSETIKLVKDAMVWQRGRG